MGLRKYFNYPSKKEAILIAEGCDKLVAMAKEKSSKHNADESNRQKEKMALALIVVIKLL